MWRQRKRLERGSHTPGIAWSHQKLEEARNEPLLKSSGAVWPRSHLNFTFSLQNCKRTHFCCFKPSSLWYFIVAALAPDTSSLSDTCVLGVGSLIQCLPLKGLWTPMLISETGKLNCTSNILSHGMHRIPEISCQKSQFGGFSETA